MQIHKKTFALVLSAVLLTAWLKDPHVQAWASGISFAIIPQAVPAANKQGNGTLFQLSTGSVTNGNCAKFDVNGNTVDAGITCGGSSVTAANIANAIYCALTSSSANVLACSTTTAFTPYPNGGLFTIRWGPATNTGNSTININTIGAKGVTVDGATNVVAGNLVASQWYTVQYEATDDVFVVLDPTPVLSARRTVCSVIGANNGSALADADLGPQSRQYFVNGPMTLLEMDVAADGGTPNIIMGRSRAGSIVNLTSSALATASAGGIACSNTGGTTGLDGTTTCSGTLQNTGFNAGDWYTLVSGTAGGVAKEMTACLTFTLVSPPR